MGGRDPESQGLLTDLAYDLIVLQDSPGYIYAIVVPVCPWHLLVDICVDTRHSAAGLRGKAQRKTDRDRCCKLDLTSRSFAWTIRIAGNSEQEPRVSPLIDGDACVTLRVGSFLKSEGLSRVAVALV